MQHRAQQLKGIPIGLRVFQFMGLKGEVLKESTGPSIEKSRTNHYLLQ